MFESKCAENRRLNAKVENLQKLLEAKEEEIANQLVEKGEIINKNAKLLDEKRNLEEEARSNITNQKCLKNDLDTQKEKFELQIADLQENSKNMQTQIEELNSLGNASFLAYQKCLIDCEQKIYQRWEDYKQKLKTKHLTEIKCAKSKCIKLELLSNEMSASLNSLTKALKLANQNSKSQSDAANQMLKSFAVDYQTTNQIISVSKMVNKNS
jgi:hypothetical protein